MSLRPSGGPVFPAPASGPLADVRLDRCLCLSAFRLAGRFSRWCCSFRLRPNAAGSGRLRCVSSPSPRPLRPSLSGTRSRFAANQGGRDPPGGQFVAASCRRAPALRASAPWLPSSERRALCSTGFCRVLRVLCCITQRFPTLAWGSGPPCRGKSGHPCPQDKTANIAMRWTDSLGGRSASRRSSPTATRLARVRARSPTGPYLSSHRPIESKPNSSLLSDAATTM